MITLRIFYTVQARSEFLDFDKPTESAIIIAFTITKVKPADATAG
jgi:hypothetical protein